MSLSRKKLRGSMFPLVSRRHRERCECYSLSFQTSDTEQAPLTFMNRQRQTLTILNLEGCIRDLPHISAKEDTRGEDLCILRFRRRGKFQKFLMSFPVLECFFFFKTGTMYPNIPWEKLFQEFRRHSPRVERQRRVRGEVWIGSQTLQEISYLHENDPERGCGSGQKRGRKQQMDSRSGSLLPHQRGH